MTDPLYRPRATPPEPFRGPALKFISERPMDPRYRMGPQPPLHDPHPHVSSEPFRAWQHSSAGAPPPEWAKHWIIDAPGGLRVVDNETFLRDYERVE